jgi:hypothetical protein
VTIMETRPTNIEIASARFPATYEQAKVALASCQKIDECQTWANKAEALASYAKMADDESLRTMADRIQARAVRRMGILLKEYDGRGRPSADNVEGNHNISQAEAAKHAGISDHQRAQAVRVANVSDAEFVAATEGDNPATVTALAEMGKKVRSVPTEGVEKATELIGSLGSVAEFCERHPPTDVAAGALPEEIAALQKHASVIVLWLDKFIAQLCQKPERDPANVYGQCMRDVRASIEKAVTALHSSKDRDRSEQLFAALFQLLEILQHAANRRSDAA